MCTICLTAQFRVFAAFSKDFEVALRYCGISVLFCIVFAGYTLSVDKLMNDVPWVGWIAVRMTRQALLRLKLIDIIVHHPGALYI